MYTVIFSSRSHEDILRIVERIAADNPEAARSFGWKLLDLAESLREMPYRGSRVRGRPGQLK